MAEPWLRKRLELEKMMGADVLFRQAGPEDELVKLEKEVAGCRRCGLWETRTQTVFGRGNPRAPLMFIGEAPGAEEDRQGLPFVGAAGKLLDKMIFAMGLTQDEVYIANILKSRPPGNRDPKPDEVEACWPFLERQIELIDPRVICTLGRPSANALLDTNASMGSLRGRWHTFKGIPLLPTYHPAYLLRSPGQKSKTWQDLKMIIQALSEGPG